MRIIRYVEDDKVYAIIVSRYSFANPNPDPAKDVKLIATQSGPEGTNIRGTLLETSRSAGKDFATINVTGALEDVERVYCLVCPKTEEAKANWFELYVMPISDRHEMPTAPFFWRLSPMHFTEPRGIRFKIRYEPHLKPKGEDPPEGTVPMVQMYPTTEPTASRFGWSVFCYRTDRDGTKAMFQSPPEWATDVTATFFFGDEHGLLFGKDPPLIVADVPFQE
jgi:hypothetical protein